MHLALLMISIIIPAYNEEKRIKETLENYINFLKDKEKFEILVVLNGCKDNTLNVVEEEAKKHKEIKFKEFKEAIGKGGAIVEGFKIVKGDYICYVDADSSTRPEELYKLYLNINGYDGIMGSRWLKDSVITNKQPFIRRFLSRGFNLLVRIFLRLNYKDTQIGAKIFKREAINKIKDDIKVTSWAFDVNILYNLKKEGFKVLEYPIVWGHDEDSTLKLRKAIPGMFYSILKIKWKK